MAAWRRSIFRAGQIGGIVVLATGCGLILPSGTGISVIRQTVDSDFYASAQVLSPDPLAPSYPEGERLIVSWAIPQDWLAEDLRLQLHSYYRNREQSSVSWPIQTRTGTHTVDCLGKDFARTKGWMTYKIEVVADQQVLLAEPHQLWFRWIEPET
jgi:hypothetical protein